MFLISVCLRGGEVITYGNKRNPQITIGSIHFTITEYVRSIGRSTAMVEHKFNVDDVEQIIIKNDPRKE